MKTFNRSWLSSILVLAAVFLSLGASDCSKETAKFCDKNYKNQSVAQACKDYCSVQTLADISKSGKRLSKDRVAEITAACQAGQYGALAMRLSLDEGRSKCEERYPNDKVRAHYCKLGLNRELMRKAWAPTGSGIGGDREGGRETGM